MEFGIMFFSSIDSSSTERKYDLLIDAAKFADENGFCCIWTPERHFDKFGGLFPNPSVISAALAVITKRIQIRAGSLISPLHNPVRVAEDWSVVDNLSNGRVAISFGSGWNIDDFIFFPDRYETRNTVMWKQIELIKALWRGEQIVQKTAHGKDVKIGIYPQPVQQNVPTWITSGGNVGTFMSAGMIGANILTQLTGQTIESLKSKIQKYRESLELNGFNPDNGRVALMLHTFVGSDIEVVKAQARDPFRKYLISAINLEKKAALGGGVISRGFKMKPTDTTSEELDELLDHSFDWYFQNASLIGTPLTCKKIISQLEEIGVNEIACLIDFINDHNEVMESLKYLNLLRTDSEVYE